MTSLLGIPAFFLALFAFWRFFYFFRNPKRRVMADDSLVLSPADGFIVYVVRVRSGEPVFSIKQGQPVPLDDLMFLDDPALPRDGWLIGIYMSPFDIHYNRAPIRGHVRKIAHRFPGDVGGVKEENVSMFSGQANLFFDLRPYWQGCDYLVRNERASYVFESERQHVYVTQIADRWISSIVSLRDGQEVAQGEVFGLIRMGSQVDTFVPDPEWRMELLVKERQHVRAGMDALLHAPFSTSTTTARPKVTCANGPVTRRRALSSRSCPTCRAARQTD
jgi:phosphatidylserine decarboxylase